MSQLIGDGWKSSRLIFEESYVIAQMKLFTREPINDYKIFISTEYRTHGSFILIHDKDIRKPKSVLPCFEKRVYGRAWSTWPGYCRAP